MPLIIRLGDAGTHGGSVVTSAKTVDAEGSLVARKGDLYACPIHGRNPITTASADVWVESKQVARHGDKASCGASLISGAVKTWVN